VTKRTPAKKQFVYNVLNHVMGAYNRLKYLNADQIDNSTFRSAISVYGLDKLEF